MNWFIALPVEAGPWLDRVQGAAEVGCVPLHPRDLHLTVAFLGAVSEERARAAWAPLQDGGWPLGPVHATLGEVVAMGDPRHPTAFAALLREGREAIERAIGAVRDPAIARAGARAELRPPKAHLTLARPERRADAAARRRATAWASAIDLGAPGVALDRLALFTSARPPGAESAPSAPRYVVVDSVAIERPAAG